MARKSTMEGVHPDHKKQVARLRRAKGQLEGIERMIQDRKYCPEIISQVKAVQSALGALNAEILETHLGHCVMNAFKEESPAKREKKIQEILKIFSKS